MNLYLPKQHGAWAMLLVPFLAGMLQASMQGIHLVLGIVWIGSYILMSIFLQWIKSRNEKFLEPMKWYALSIFPFWAALTVMKPELIIWWMIYGFGFCTNVYFAYKKNERSIWNDLTAVSLFSLFAVVAFSIESESMNNGWYIGLLCWLYFTGTVFYVKTMIREKGNISFYKVSVAMHLVFSVGAFFLSTFVGYIMVLALIRAVIGPNKSWSVMQVGFGEVILSTLLLIALNPLFLNFS